MKIMLASNNDKKIKELEEILTPLGYQIVKQASLGISEAIEDGLSFVENALIKARHAARACQMPTIADDSGLEVDALSGQPGIYSARYAGANASDKANLDKLLQEMHGQENRRARYRCVIVMLQHALDPMPIIAQGTWEGRITTHPIGDQGFGYDPIFQLQDSSLTAAQISSTEKARLSHRGQALQDFHQQLSTLAGK